MYLHAGTRTGAKALGFEGRATARLHELPEPVPQLQPYALEDCLFLYKDYFTGRLRAAGRLRKARS